MTALQHQVGACAFFISVLTLLSGIVTAQERTGYEMNAESCTQVDQNNVTIGFYSSASEFLYSSPSLEGIPQDCLPTNLDVYGAWYKLLVPSNAHTGRPEQIGAKFHTLDSGVAGGVPHSLAVLRGNGCGSLTCIGFSEVQDVEASVTFSLTTNAAFYLFFAVERVVNAFVPSMVVERLPAKMHNDTTRHTDLGIFDVPIVSPLPIGLEEPLGPLTVSFSQGNMCVLDVKDSQGIVTCAVDGGNGDLAVGIDVMPTKEIADCRSDSYGSQEQCSIVVDKEVAQVFVHLHGYESSVDGATLECQLATLDGAETFDLEDGDFSTDFEIAEDEHLLCEVRVPSKATRMSCGMQLEDESNVSMFMRVEEMPIPHVEGRHDCFSNTSTTDEGCKTFAGIKDASVYVLLVGNGHVSNGGRLQCSVSFQEIERGRTEVGIDLGLDEQHLFYFDVPVGTRHAWCNSTIQSGSARLYVRMGHQPMPGIKGDPDDGVFDCVRWLGVQEDNGDTGSTKGGILPLVPSFATRSERVICQTWWAPTHEGEIPPATRIYALLDTTTIQYVFEGARLAITCNAVTLDQAKPVDIDTAVNSFDMVVSEWKLFYVDVPESTERVVCYADSESGDFSVRMKVQDMLGVGSNADCSIPTLYRRNRCSIPWRQHGLSRERVYILVTERNWGTTDMGSAEWSNSPSVAGGKVWCEITPITTQQVAASKSNPDVP